MSALWLLLATLTSTGTSTATSVGDFGGGLFSEEAIPDDVASGDVSGSSLFEKEEPQDSSTAARSGFQPSFRALIELGVGASADFEWQLNEQVFELTIFGRIEMEARLTEGLSLYANPKFRHVSAWDKEGNDRQFLYLLAPEAYGSWTYGKFRLRAGSMIFSWGASDLIGPNDVLNPIDGRSIPLGASSISEMKIPVIAAEASVQLGKLTITGVVEPFFSPTRFFLTGWDTAASKVLLDRDLSTIEELISPSTIDIVGDTLVVIDRPSDNPTNATFGGRLAFSVGDFDLGANAVYGWDPLPEIKLDEDLLFLGSELARSVINGEPFDIFDPEIAEAVGRVRDATEQGRTLVGGQYSRRSMLGFDVSWALDPVVLKLDAAYSFDRTLYTQDFQSVRHPWLNTAVGLEYIHGEDFQLLVEAFAITVFDVKSYYRILIFEPLAPPPSMFDVNDRTIVLPGAMGVARYAILGGDLQFELGGGTTFDRGDYAVLPALRWRVTDHHRMVLGAVVLGGKEDGYGGIYGNNDQVYLNYTWSP